MASGAAQAFRHTLQAVLKGHKEFDGESQFNVLAMVRVLTFLRSDLPRGLDQASCAG